MQGSCHCGAVRFAAEGPLRDGVACHCTQCRKTSGHFWAASTVPLDRFRLLRDDGLAWYRSSPDATRGFCRFCGASLLWKPEHEDRISFALGALDEPAGVTIARHIFTADAGDYYAPEGPPPAAGALAGDPLHAACLCGGVAMALPRPEGGVTACHCAQCRKISGHFAASFDTAEAGVVYLARETLATYRPPGGSTRGFCARCGSSLWFRAADGSFSVEAGAVDGATGLVLSGHIFVAGRPDYYLIDDGLPQAAGWS